MTRMLDSLLPGYVLLVLLGLMLAVLALRLADETAQKPRNHLIIVGGALLAFGLVYRGVDVLTYLDVPRWSSVVGALGVLAFLAADQRVASRYGRIWRRLAGHPATTLARNAAAARALAPIPTRTSPAMGAPDHADQAADAQPEDGADHDRHGRDPRRPGRRPREHLVAEAAGGQRRNGAARGEDRGDRRDQCRGSAGRPGQERRRPGREHGRQHLPQRYRQEPPR